MKLRRALRIAVFVAIVALVVGLSFGLVACGGDDESGSGGDAGDGGEATVDTINGAGASFPFPLYSAWASDYNKETGVKVNYQSIGSSGGIEQITNRTVDFGASDAPLSQEELDEIGLIQFPMTCGGVVAIFNAEGVESEAITLNGPVLADIFAGKITKWNDDAIAALNEGVEMPDKDITVVHRSDGSGTTFIFTSYLSAVSDDWANDFGAEKEIAWATGVGGEGNEGVAGQVSQIDGAIGYVEYAYAKQNDIPVTKLINADGNAVSPSLETFAEAAGEADWAGTPGMAVILVNEPGANAWPIAGATFILLYKEQEDAAVGKAMFDFFSWCLKNGGATAEGLDYVALPDNVVQLIEEMWASDVTGPDGAAIWEM